MTTSARGADPAELEGLAVALARGAAQVVRDGRDAGVVRDGLGSGLEVGAKSTPSDLVTEVDRRTERWLVAEIARYRPGDAVLGEEGGDHAGTTGVRWVLDPIDGTVNFILGIPQYAVSVAVEVDAEVIAGAVCNPVTGETFRAHGGGGAYLGGQRLTGPRDVPLSRAVIGTGFSYDADRRARQVAVVAPLLPRIADLRRLGASSLDLCFVAAGRLDGYFEAGLNRWDYAAGALIAREAGCTVTGLHERPASPRLIAVTGAGLSAEFFAALESLGADSVTGLSS